MTEEKSGLFHWTGAGHEQSGKRPVLIVSKASFNTHRLPLLFRHHGGNVTCAKRVCRYLDGAERKNDWDSLRPAEH
jgi:hypothetical protein